MKKLKFLSSKNLRNESIVADVNYLHSLGLSINTICTCLIVKYYISSDRIYEIFRQSNLDKEAKKIDIVQEIKNTA